MNFLGENTFNYIGDALCVIAGFLLIHNILRNKNVAGKVSPHHRTVLPHAITLHRHRLHQILRYFLHMERTLHPHHQGGRHLQHCLHRVFNEMQATILPQSRQISGLLPPLLPLLDQHSGSYRRAQIAVHLRFPLVLQHLVGGPGDSSPTKPHPKTQINSKPHGNLCAAASFAPNFLSRAYVLKIIARILHWEQVEWTSFLASIVQTLLFADFIYYYSKATKLKGIMTFPV